MSYSVDVNVLLYASDASSPKHAEAICFLKHSRKFGLLEVADPFE
ncbi:MAG TPA: hypothetical protein VN203_01250 [Candidatus Acidoferrum sp.]|nr:hypothetical protein [Candidatus Methylomirabilis sp.]HWU36237.1 hypothetical protein [Candidatus Acidoferrum sp.]